jgi:DNA-binding MarR family transcriptional regulator
MSKEREELMEEVRAAFRLNGQAGDAMDQAASEFLGVHRTDTRLLDVLQMQGRMSAGELAKAGQLSPAAVTAALDRLEEAGYLRRVRDEQDRRRVLVEITDRLRELAWVLYGPLAKSGEAMLEPLTEEQLALMRDIMRESARLQLEQAARVREQLSGEPGAAPRRAAGRSAG